MVQKFAAYLLSALRIQLFISLVAMPILVLWGLSVSVLSIPGNILFAPILTIFLLASSLIFFLELIYLPNNWLIQVLEKLTLLWLGAAPENNVRYLLAFPQKTWFIFILSLILAIYVIAYLDQFKHIWWLSLLLVSSCLIAKLPIWTQETTYELTKNKQKLKINFKKGNIIIHDYGIFNHSNGIQTWIKYQLIPSLIKNFGILKIKSLYLSKPSKHTQINLEILKNNLIIESIHLG